MTRLFESKPFIIAEVGSNWENVGHCIQSIEAAKACGADAVKYQLFDEVALYGAGYQVPSYGAPVRPPFLPPAWLPQLKEACDVQGIEFMCTAFSPELVAAVDPYVKVHKVASSDLNYPQLLEAVARTGKPVLLSTGAASSEEINQALTAIGGGIPFAQRGGRLLYCVSAYPADYIDLTRAGWDYGLSDHTLGYTACVEFARRGGKVIEKHFTAFPDLDTPDRPHSLTPKQFKRMVDIIRGREVESEEAAMHLRHKRRLIATKDLEAGTSVLLYGQTYGAYRSLVDDERGLSPFLWREVEGTIAQRDIKRGQSIGLGDFK